MILKQTEEPLVTNELIEFKEKPTLDDLLNLSSKYMYSSYNQYKFDNLTVIESDNKWLISIMIYPKDIIAE